MKQSRLEVWLMSIGMGLAAWAIDFIDLRSLLHAAIYGGAALLAHWVGNR